MNPIATVLTVSIAIVAIAIVICLLKNFFFQTTGSTHSKLQKSRKSRKNAEPCLDDIVQLKAIQYVRDGFGQKLTDASGDYIKIGPGHYQLKAKTSCLINDVEERLLGFKDSNDHPIYVKFMPDATEVAEKNSNTPVEE